MSHETRSHTRDSQRNCRRTNQRASAALVLLRDFHNAHPSSMMHGAVIVSLHKSPASVIALVQQADCRPGEGQGIRSLDGRTSTHAHLWLRDIVYRDEYDLCVLTLAYFPELFIAR